MPSTVICKHIQYHIPSAYLLTQGDDVSFYRDNQRELTLGSETIPLMTKPALGKGIFTPFRPPLKSGVWLVLPSIWPISWTDTKSCCSQARVSVEPLRCPVSQVSLFTFYSAAHLMPSSSLDLTLALFSNSISINNHCHDGEEPSVGNSEPFRFATHRRN